MLPIRVLNVLRARLRYFLPRRTSPKRPGPYLLAENDAGLYCLPRQAVHRPACQAILGGQIWERETVQFLCDHARGAIVHGGTFFGDFLPALSRAYSWVWAFEPNPDSFQCATITIQLNRLTNVSLLDCGMGELEGRATLCTERHGIYLGGGSFIVESEGDTPIQAVDQVVPSECDVGAIHLDVERYEGPALAGARHTIERCRPVIVVETIPQSNLLSELGYTHRRVINGNHIFMCD